MSNSKDIAIISLPIMSLFRPAPAPAVLKAAVESEGFSAYASDFNAYLYDYLLKVDNSLYSKLELYFQLDVRYVDKKINFTEKVMEKKKSFLSSSDISIYENALENYIDDLLKDHFEYIGLSIFSVNSIISALDFINMLKKKSCKSKIIIGGLGIDEFNFIDYCKDNNLVDHSIKGEGESALISLLKKNKTIGVDDSKNYTDQVIELHELPFPDYQDYNLNIYFDNPPELAITSSRGCIRDCSFCDVGKFWPKFVHREGKGVADEILHYYQKYSIDRFVFTDSLINGATKPFINMCENIIEYIKDGKLPESLRLSGQFICRPEKKFPEFVYELMHKAKIKEVFVGIESGSQKVITEMGKNHTIYDHDLMMSYLNKYNIQCQLMFIVGYPTETLNDFNMTKDMLKRYRIYSDNNIIRAINLSKTLAVLPGSPLGKYPERFGVEYTSQGDWLCKTNKSLNLKERIRRRLELQEYAESLHYRIRWTVPHLNILKDMAISGSQYL